VYRTGKSGIRQRSGGRAASLILDNAYSIDDQGHFQAEMIDVKGIGTHKFANVDEYARALRLVFLLFVTTAVVKLLRDRLPEPR
jgi:hypothetical protein